MPGVYFRAMQIILVLLCVLALAVILRAVKSSNSAGTSSDIEPLSPLELRQTSNDLSREKFHEKALQEAQHASHEPALTKEIGCPNVRIKSTPETQSNLASWLPEEFVVLDLETTGLSPVTDEIIEIGAIRFRIGAETHATFQSLVKPEKAISQTISRLTGITQQMVKNDGLPAAEALEEFTTFIGELPLVTFNAPFDMGFLWNAGKKHGMVIKNRYACALQMSRRAWPELPSHRLADLAKIASLPDDDTHRALGDSTRALHIFAAAVSKIGLKVRWEYYPLDWHLMVEYNKVRDANLSFCAQTRPLESRDISLAISRYAEAMARMYEYEGAVDGRYANAQILDRLTLCLWKTGQYSELVESIEKFVRTFPDVESSLMTAVLKRKERAVSKIEHAAN